MEIEEEKSIDSFQAELDLENLEEEENTVSQKERLAKILETIKSSQNAQINEESQQNQEEKPQVLRAGNPNVLRAGAPKKITQNETTLEPFVSNFNLDERYFFQNININEWNDITTFIEKFISDENLGEKDLEEFFNNHPKISKGNITKLQGSVADIFSKKKDLKKYKILINFLIKKYYKPKPVICECYFFPNPSNEQRVVNMFRTCKKTLDIAIFTFTRDSIAQAILEAHQRGVKIRCIGDDGNSKVKGSDVRLLASIGIPCKTDNNIRFHMHNKMAIIDNSVVITGSFNWTNQAVNKNQDNILFIEDKNIANQYTEYYNHIWDTFNTVITKEDAKKYMEEEKKAQEKKDEEKQKTEKKDITTPKKETTKKETTKKETTKKETTKKETTKKETTKKETTKKETTKKETTKKETTKKESTKKESTKKEGTAKKTTAKKETTKKETTKKEKASTSKEKEPTKKKTESKTSTSKAKTAKSTTKKETTKPTSSAKGKSTKEKSKSKDTKEKRGKTMKEIKKSSSVKSKEKTIKKSKERSTKPKTTKEKKKEKVEKSKPKTTKRVRGVKSEPKKTQKKKK